MTTIGSLFSGYGGLEMAVEAVTGGRAVWCSDNDPGACKILAHRFPGVPNLGDITRIDWSTVTRPDVLTGGFPCQDVSNAGRRAGMKPGTRSGLWQKMVEAVDVLRPSLVVAENVRGLLSADAHSDVEPCPWCVGNPGDEPPLRALGAVLGDLADIGYDAAWHGLRASDVGAPHGRFRIFIVAWLPANPDITGSQGPQPAQGRDLSYGRVAADPASDGWDEGWPEPAGIIRGSDAAERGAAVADADRDGVWAPAVAEPGCSGATVPIDVVPWGQFEPAIRRWERLTRPAPAPTETSSRGAQRLSPRFVEWMMGLPDQHVTGVPDLTRNEQLTALGNGVVPQQAAAALRILLPVIP